MQMVGRLCVAGAILLASVCFAAPHPRYRVIDLGVLPGGSSSTAMALNDKGEVVGDCEMPSGPHAFLYSNGAMIDLNDSLTFTIRGALFTPPRSHAQGINNRSEVIGHGTYRSGPTSPVFLYSNGVVSYYNGISGPYIDNHFFPYFFALNDHGHIVGLASGGPGAALTDRERVWIYPTLAGQTYPYAVNNRNEAVGWSRGPAPGFDSHAVIFRTNGIIDLGIGEAIDINDLGHVVGAGKVVRFSIVTEQRSTSVLALR